MHVCDILFAVELIALLFTFLLVTSYSVNMSSQRNDRTSREVHQQYTERYSEK